MYRGIFLLPLDTGRHGKVALAGGWPRSPAGAGPRLLVWEGSSRGVEGVDLGFGWVGGWRRGWRLTDGGGVGSRGKEGCAHDDTQRRIAIAIPFSSSLVVEIVQFFPSLHSLPPRQLA